MNIAVKATRKHFILDALKIFPNGPRIGVLSLPTCNALLRAIVTSEVGQTAYVGLTRNRRIIPAIPYPTKLVPSVMRIWYAKLPA
jgi:hypothetical protein